jgi:hypothetical protein
MPERIITIMLPLSSAVAINQFLIGALQQMKEQASAIEWDSPEIKVMVSIITNLILQLPTEIEG